MQDLFFYKQIAPSILALKHAHSCDIPHDSFACYPKSLITSFVQSLQYILPFHSGLTPGILFMAAKQLAIVALYAAHGDEVLASHSVQCAVLFLNSVDAKPKERCQEGNAIALTQVGPAVPFSLGAISAMSSPVKSRPIISGHHMFQVTYTKSHQGLVVISKDSCHVRFL